MNGSASDGGFRGTLVVERKERIADDVVSVTLRRPDLAALPSWEPGAHIDIVVPTVGVARQYSLSGPPSDQRYWRIGVLREPAGRASTFLHDQVDAGDELEVRGPRNNFRLLPSRRYLFLAGGIGITPILPMIVAAADADWTLHYGASTMTAFSFRDELAEYGDRVHLHPQDEAGFIPLETVLGSPRDDTLVYCCGPEGLLQAVEAFAPRWPPGSLHWERFAPKTEAHRTSTPFEIKLQSTGDVFRVPVGKSMLDVLEEAGVDVLASCREGTCGTCETGVLAGIPDHRDSLLTAAESEVGDTVMICVSRATSPLLVLDL